MASNLLHLDLTACELTSVSAKTLGSLIESQSFKRQAEAWKDSLRYGRPDLDRIRGGIRRLTLNSNPMLRDSGALELARALQNDLWLKALDLQACGLTNEAARAFLERLGGGHNSSIYILDLRLNDGVDKTMLKRVMEMVLANNANTAAGLNDFEWLNLAPITKRTQVENKPKQTPRVESSKRHNTGPRCFFFHNHNVTFLSMFGLHFQEPMWPWSSVRNRLHR